MRRPSIVCLLTATVFHAYIHIAYRYYYLHGALVAPDQYTAARQINFTASILRADISKISRRAPTRSVIRAPVLGRDLRRGGLRLEAMMQIWNSWKT